MLIPLGLTAYGLYEMRAAHFGPLNLALLAAIRERGLAVLLVEQRAQRTVALADRSHVLANGKLRLTLGPQDAANTDKLVAAYFA